MPDIHDVLPGLDLDKDLEDTKVNYAVIVSCDIPDEEYELALACHNIAHAKKAAAKVLRFWHIANESVTVAHCSALNINPGIFVVRDFDVTLDDASAEED